MPPSWPSRLLSSSSSSAPTNSTSSSNSRSNKPLPNLPIASGIPSRIPSSPPRTGPSTDRQHTHNRSASHPLPRLFSKKKSTGNFGNLVSLDVPVDDALVPILDDDHLTTSPTKPVRGRQDDEQFVTRHCMCCYSKVRFPKGLVVFRCTSCFTVNDLEPCRPKKREEGGGERLKDAGDDKQHSLFLGPRRK